MRHFLLLSFLLSAVIFLPAQAQKKITGKKYPSLFWEISGNGLKKPSYLFGTMHVSSKMVFHLSDSFYYAMRHTDAVALELNPEVWQDEMFRLQKAQMNLAHFSLGKMNDYLNEGSFQLDKYEDDVKKALTEEPTVVNNLLYRSYQPSADFEENTYLDLYIYQTGRKLGKQPAGVEDYMESEKLMMEAYQDMAKDKSRKRPDTDGESFYEIQKKIQQAYRNGDLDLMDSLQNITSASTVFAEKFLYLRNQIQANSIDTILRRHSLFVGVGAAHLPGERGVIELLRKKGYSLRPIFMQDRDAVQKDDIDKLRVPVVFRQEKTTDGLIELKLPGKLYKREEARGNESWQFADMDNGSYYMLTRVRTHAAIFGHSSKTVLNKVDSMLYENIPGRIIKKISITKDGYPGFDITNRTRRGDLQRYQIFVTPFEVLVFKMSGSDNYVNGKEAESFFSSLTIKPASSKQWNSFSPKQGGFRVNFPGTVNEALNKNTSDGTDRWEYESVDSTTGNAYMVWKKTLHNFNFIEEDTFDLSLLQESFKSSEIISSQLSRKQGVENGYPFLESTYSLKDGGFIEAKSFIKGPQYYLVIARNKNKKTDNASFFNSFTFTPFNYSVPVKYIDSTLQLEVQTSVKPNVDTVLRKWIEMSANDALSRSEGAYPAWPRTKTGIFKSDSTGESILVSVQNFPKYYFSRDSARFWKDKLDEQEISGKMIFKKKEYFRLSDSICGYKVLLTDTNSSRSIKIVYSLKNNYLYKISTITDTAGNESEFVKTFFATAVPITNDSVSVFKNKLNIFFADLNSKDSVVLKQAITAIPAVYFGREGLPGLLSLIDHLKYSKNYVEIKSKLITELGFINYNTATDKIVSFLKNVYEKNSDTSSVQNAVVDALARLQTKSSYQLLKELLVQDPPVFNNSYEYSRLFSHFKDTLALAKTLFPEILQLSSVDDYKPFINTLLKNLVDSGYLKASAYNTYFSKLFFDAKIEFKKQQNNDENHVQKDGDDDDDNNDMENDVRNMFKGVGKSSSTSSLSKYAALLIPFYNKSKPVQHYFDKLLQSKNVNVQLVAANLLLINNKKIPDSLFASVASHDQYRAKLLSMLENLNKKEWFPAIYKNQESIAKSLLLNDKGLNKFADIQLAGTKVMEWKGSKGNVYLFKYKIRKEDDWKMGISGMQPIDKNEVSSDAGFVKMTDKKLKAGEPEADQFNAQIKKLILLKHKSGKRFYETQGSWDYAENNLED